jgi:hypothetical protein
MTIDEAIDIAWGIDKFRGGPRPTVQAALEFIDQQLATCGFNWLTGQEARQVLREALTQSTFPRQKEPMAKTTLTVDIEYDASVTDPEALASAADRLLETVLSTPGIMDEYGKPRFGEFFVARPASDPPQQQLLVIAEISGGTLQEVYASDPAVRTVLVDWDNENCLPGQDLGIVEVTGNSGRSQHAFVSEVPTLSIADIQDTDAGQALRAAGIECQQAQQVRRRWVLYDLDGDELLGTRVYTDHAEAVEDAAQANDILVLPLVIPGIAT